VLQSIGQDTQGQSLDADDGLVAGGAVAEHAWKVRDLADPAAIVLAFEIDAKAQTHCGHCSTRMPV